MSSDPTRYQSFRARLDAVLRQKDAQALRAFLVAEGQWQEDATVDAESAMWMMIAASKALRDLHEEARAWLMTHGHEVEAQAILGSLGSKAPTKDRDAAAKRGSDDAASRRQGSRHNPPSSPSRRGPSHGHANGRRPRHRS
jgi:hypothetical protein